MKQGDLIGRSFGMLTVAEDSGQRKGHSILWRCGCDCGGEILAVRHELVSGRVTDCGCTSGKTRAGVRDLIGKRFGMLTVAEDSGQRKGSGVILWKCICDCGGTTLATRQQLVSGNVASCGCLPRQTASKKGAEDLTGRQFGELTVLRRAENSKRGRVCWLCRCSCGREAVVEAQRLKSGHTRSCGCRKKASAYNKRDLRGQRFGRLTALYHVTREDRATTSYWHCRCDCGRELDVYTMSLLRGVTRSCGCWNREQSSDMHEHMHYQDDTCAEILERICADTGKRRSKAGFRGLFCLDSGKYRASITFQGKHYNLGHYEQFSDAVRARLQAEEVLHKGYLEALKRYRTRAKEDPEWAQANPFFYRVARVNGDFQISTNG